jgi:hypothetical protein
MSGYGSGENSEKRVMEGIEENISYFNEEKRKREAQELNARKQKNNILYKRQTWRNAYRNATLRLLNLTGKGFKKNNTKIIFGKTKKS